jgi:predicted kinase
MKPLGKLTFFCGKMGAGKSTRAKAVAAANNAVLISEDEWLSAHFGEQINSFDDYVLLSRRIKPFLRQHVQAILRTGTSVVMDFPANTVAQRSWFIQLCAETGCEHELIYLDIGDAQCLVHIAKRRVEQPQRAQFDTEAMFFHVSQFFEYPTGDENLNIRHLMGVA